MIVVTLASIGGRFGDDLGRGLREGFFMFFETFWALILGFGCSGFVQAFVSREGMQRQLGDHRPAAVLRGSLFGMASSSCSYAASAMAKALFQRGADFVTAMVFMLASTNLVIELGIVLVVLIGWQFMAAEFVGGIVMIALVALLGGFIFRGRSLDEARRRVMGEADVAHLAPGDRGSLSEQFRSFSRWSDAATFSMADLKMLRREMVIGYGIAGFLAALVPNHVWNDVFLRGHGFVTVVENAAVAPAIALISCVCSIGNVPLAAALWHGGISFAGVVSFVFADLIALPVLFVYKKLYGTPMALRILGLFWVVMTVAGLVTEGLFHIAGLVPTNHSISIPVDRLSWNSTAYLNVAFLIVLAALYVLSRNRQRFGTDTSYAIDPVCGMQVERALAPATMLHNGETIYFCSGRCKERFAADPQRFNHVDGAAVYEGHDQDVEVTLRLTPRRKQQLSGGDEVVTSVAEGGAPNAPST